MQAAFLSLLALLLAALLVPAAQAQSSQERIPDLILTGTNNHDWQWTAPSLEAILEDPDTLGRFAAVVVDYNGPRLGPQAEANFMQAVRAGLGVTIIHAANNSFDGWKEYESLLAFDWRKGTGHGRSHPFDVLVEDRNQPITRTEREFGDFVFKVDVKIEVEGNSGIQLRSQRKETGQVYGYQAEIAPPSAPILTASTMSPDPGSTTTPMTRPPARPSSWTSGITTASVPATSIWRSGSTACRPPTSPTASTPAVFWPCRFTTACKASSIGALHASGRWSRAGPIANSPRTANKGATLLWRLLNCVHHEHAPTAGRTLDQRTG